MLDPLALSPEVREAIIENKGWDKLPAETIHTNFSNMTASEAFEAYCQWHGLLGWSSRLTSVIENISKAEVRPLHPEQQKMVVWHEATSCNREVADHTWDPSGGHWYWFVGQRQEEGWTHERDCGVAK